MDSQSLIIVMAQLHGLNHNSWKNKFAKSTLEFVKYMYKFQALYGNGIINNYYCTWLIMYQM